MSFFAGCLFSQAFCCLFFFATTNVNFLHGFPALTVRFFCEAKIIARKKARGAQFAWGKYDLEFFFCSLDLKVLHSLVKTMICDSIWTHVQLNASTAARLFKFIWKTDVCRIFHERWAVENSEK